MRATEKFVARGHVSILSSHRNTFEITKDIRLTPRGDCVVAVASQKAVRDLSEEMKGILKKADSRLTIILQAGEEREIVEARGSPDLRLSHAGDIVVRKSSFVCDRTLAVKSNKAAIDFSKTFVRKLRNPQQEIDITLIARAQ